MRIRIAEGQVWRAKRKFRRVVTVLRDDSYIAYSSGGEHMHYCERTTFLRWRSDNNAKLSRGPLAVKRKRDGKGRFTCQ